MVTARMQHGRWAPGLREVLARLAREYKLAGPLYEGEKTDEEIAEDEVKGSVTLGWISTPEYMRFIAYELDTLRPVSASSGLIERGNGDGCPCDLGQCRSDASFCPGERTPIGWTGYGIFAGSNVGCGSACRIRV
jgi:hypothetical protein